MARTDAGSVINKLSWTLESLEKEGYDGACLKIGNAALRMLESAHPHDFKKYPLIIPEKSDLADPVIMVSELIHRSLKYKTKNYVTAIDELFSRHKAELGNSSLPEVWIELRDTFLGFKD